ncbi:MAG: helix-turn-helix transcriptional regulator [Parcubacteria group bacterium]|nr:helix-turn-helix transcriptional regulator [Parcubacteria group bacterium]
MSEKHPQSIQKALIKRELVPQEKVWRSYSQKDREEILERVRYLKAAMELRRLRKRLHLSQEQLAKKIAVKREFISKVESGRQNVTLETLYRIAQATGKQLMLSFR